MNMSDEDIYRLRRSIVEQLLRHADPIGWQLSPHESLYKEERVPPFVEAREQLAL